MQERRAIHESHHQDLSGGKVLYNGGNEAAHFVEIEFYIHSDYLSCKNKKPAERYRVSGLNLRKCLAISGAHPRQRAVRVMMAMVEMRRHVLETKIRRRRARVNRRERLPPRIF
jgi:hypothetical protein